MYITHYCSSISPAFKRITQYSSNDRIYIANELAKIKGSALQRFKDFEWYYDRRIKTEKWLYKSAIELNCVPTVNSPWYFVLGESDMLKQGFGINSQAYQLNLDIIDSQHITFTIGDSIAVYYSKSINNTIYNKDTIEYLFSHCNEKINYLFSKLSPKHRYIEAQLWDKKYLCTATSL